MADLPEIIYALNDDAAAPEAVAGDETYGTLAELLAALPALTEPDAATELARAVTHFARGRDYIVIDDPAAFESAYRKQLEGEDPNTPFQQGVVRLTDFGVPDFTKIAAPVQDGGVLTWTAADRFSGLPYAASAPMSDLGALTIKPMSLTRVAGRISGPEDPAIAEIESPASATASESEPEQQELDDLSAGDAPNFPPLKSFD